MKLNALDIRKQEFSTRFRGYDPDEVESFVQMMAQQWQELTDDMRRLEQRIDEQSTKLNHYMKVEEALEQALETAREGARQRLETADQRASATVDDAERRARALVEDAEYRSRSLVDESEKRARAIVSEAERRAGALLAEAEDRHIRARQAVSDATMRRGEIVARLRAFLTTEMQLLSGFEGDQDPEWMATEATSARTVKPAGHPVDEIALPRATVTGDDDRLSAPYPASATSRPAVPETPRSPEPVVPVQLTVEAPFEEPRSDESDALRQPEHKEVSVDPFEVEESPSTSADASLAQTEPLMMAAAADGPSLTDEDAEWPEVVSMDLTSLSSVDAEPEAKITMSSSDSMSDELNPPDELAADGVHPPVDEPPAAGVDAPVDDPSAAGVHAPVDEPKVRRIKAKTPAAKQVDLLDDSNEYGGASDEIKKIRRILEDLDR